jgi:hypothetical protein
MSHMRFGLGLDGRHTAFILCLLGLFAYEGYALFVQEGGTTSHLPPARDLHLTREVNQTASLQQTFVMHAEGFQGIEVVARASDQPAVGPLEAVVWQLEYNAGDRYIPIARTRFDSSSIVLGAFTRIPTPRIDYTGGVSLKLELSMPESPPGHGLRFDAGGPTYVQGNLFIGGREEWGDLKFRTVAQRTTVFRNIRRLRTGLPPLLQTDVFWVSALIAINWALATVVYSLAFAHWPNGSEAGTADQPRV